MKIRVCLSLCVFMITLPVSSEKAWSASTHLNELNTAATCSRSMPDDVNVDHYKWPKSNVDAYHNNSEVYFDKELFYCHGDTAETKDIVYAWPSWPFATREDWFYPLQFIDTSSGLLATRGRETTREVLLNGEAWIKDVEVGGFVQALPEPDGNPEIIIMYLLKAGEPLNEGADVPTLRLIDMGVSPPYVSETSMQIGNTAPKAGPSKEAFPQNNVAPAKRDVDIRKVDDDRYIISGWTYGRYNPDDPSEMLEPPSVRRYIYQRATRSLTVLK